MDAIQLLNGTTVPVPHEVQKAGPAAVEAFIAEAHTKAGLADEFAENKRVAAAYAERRAKAPTIKDKDGTERPETEDESRTAVRAKE